MSYPAGLHVIERPAAGPGAPTVILVHGSLDRAESFRRVMRRLPEFSLVAYDRRGYQESRDAGVVDLGGHMADLVEIAADLRSRGVAPVSAVGHSLGGDVVVGAALAEPRAFDSIGAFEPPMPWLGFRRPPPGSAAPGWTPLADDPGEEAERFFSRMVSPSAWGRLTEAGRDSHHADGPALVGDLTGIRGAGRPFNVMSLTVPAVFGLGGPGSQTHHRQTVTWLGGHVPGAMAYEIEGAQHGAHLSHPDHFAAFVRLVVERGSH